MHRPRILAFAGSARTGSFNKMLVRIAGVGAERAGAELTYIDLRDFPMPIYDADLEAAEGLPPNALAFKKLLAEHDALLIASPENNSTVSALLKNALDWASRSAPGEPAFSAFDKKVAGLLSASTGVLGGVRGLAQLRALLENMRVMVIPDQKTIPKAKEAFGADGALVDDKAREAAERVGAALARVAAKLCD
ncbi:MAG: NADPH-dependent reductase [Candidatus Krumholzibacteriota bacterium]|nr:NADPH-dependent reductase [Candidatus Krumholzibacteriota bacterium]